ncbi:MAG: FHA domain-containing protein [Candidatus Eremiobacterota bacterium]
MSELTLFGLKFALLAVLYLVLAALIRALVRDLPMPALDVVPSPSPRPAPEEPPRFWLQAVEGHERLADRQPVPIHGAVLIGRGGDCQVRLLDPFASVEHARIVPQACGVLLEDLKSTNGTLRGTVPVVAPVVLEEGDTFTIGDVTFQMTRSPRP